MDTTPRSKPSLSKLTTRLIREDKLKDVEKSVVAELDLQVQSFNIEKNIMLLTIGATFSRENK